MNNYYHAPERYRCYNAPKYDWKTESDVPNNVAYPFITNGRNYKYSVRIKGIVNVRRFYTNDDYKFRSLKQRISDHLQRFHKNMKIVKLDKETLKIVIEIDCYNAYPLLNANLILVQDEDSPKKTKEYDHYCKHFGIVPKTPLQKLREKNMEPYREKAKKLLGEFLKTDPTESEIEEYKKRLTREMNEQYEVDVKQRMEKNIAAAMCE